MTKNDCTHGYAHKRRNCPTCADRDALLAVLRASRALIRANNRVAAGIPCDTADKFADLELAVHWADYADGVPNRKAVTMRKEGAS